MNAVLDECRDLKEISFEPGEKLIHEGAAADRMFVLIEGEVAVSKGPVQVAVDRKPGSLFGEMSALLETNYTASVVAVTPVRAYQVEKPIEFMTRRPGLAIHAARLLAQRLHDGTTYLADLKVQFEDRKDHLGMVDQVLDALMHHQRKVAGGRDTRGDDPRL